MPVGLPSSKLGKIYVPLPRKMHLGIKLVHNCVGLLDPSLSTLILEGDSLTLFATATQSKHFHLPPSAWRYSWAHLSWAPLDRSERG